MAPSAHETQLSNESLVGTDHAPDAEVDTIANRSIEDDTLDADEYLGTDEDIGMDNLNMDGNYSQDDDLSEDEDTGADGNPSEDDIDADEPDSDENPDVDEIFSTDSSTESLADNTLEQNTDHKVSKRSRRILEDIEKVRQGVLKADIATKNLKRKAAESEDGIYERYKIEKMRREAQYKRFTEGMGTLETENIKLRRDLRDAVRETTDRDFIIEANKHLRIDLDATKAKLRKERDEKADYHDIKEERTEFHRKYIKKANECRGLERKNAELQRKLDEEASFSAQVMAMFSKEPKI